MNKKENWNEVLKELQIVYLKDLNLRLPMIQSLVDANLWDKTEHEFHKIKGTGKTYGFGDFSLLAERLEIESQKQEPATAIFNSGLLCFHHCLKAYEALIEPDLQNFPEFAKLRD